MTASMTEDVSAELTPGSVGRKSDAEHVPALRFPEFVGAWEEFKLGDIGPVSMCKRIFKDETESVGDIPFYKIGTFGKEADAFITRTKFEEFKRNHSFPQVGDILISAAGTIGRTVIYNGEDAYFQDSNIVWIANDQSKVANSFLAICYENIKWTTENTTIARLYNANLKSKNIAVPSLPEQKKIAAFLGVVDDKITALRARRDALTRYKRGLMQAIFSQDLRFTRPDGSAFPDWEEKRLGEVLHIEMGQSPGSSSYNDKGVGLPLIQGNADIRLRRSAPRRFTSEVTKTCEIGDILLSVRAPVGEVAISMHKACIGRGIASLKARLGQSHDYWHQFLLNFEPRWVSIEQGSTFAAISGPDIRKLKVTYPHPDEQAQIADALSAMDAKTDAVTDQITKMEAFKKGLLQQMFV